MQLLKDFWLLVKSYPISCRIVRELNSADYPGVVKTQIAYQKARTALVKDAKYVDAKITGSVVYIALSLAAYRHAS
jgi:hypothetical protein